MVVFDTNMISERKQNILNILKDVKEASSSEIHARIDDSVALVTIKRELAELLELGHVQSIGGGRSLRYQVTTGSRIFLPVNASKYNAIELDKRKGVEETYDFNIWNSFPESLFSVEELKLLNKATDDYGKKSSLTSNELHKKELERFIIEMSWKSSRIEGNTYTLLDTELLLKEGVASKKNTKEETQMILNHKKAFDFTIEQKRTFLKTVTTAHIENVHALLTEDLLKEQGYRKSIVGITGSRYTPLDNQYQIKEAVESLIIKINTMQDPYSKALSALIGISYIQPFVDGNKRTARLVANALLISSNCAPLSYRNVDESMYRESMLTFYEQLSIVPMKQILIDQYIFATKTYSSVA